MMIRGVRGATTVDVDEPEAVGEATRQLLRAMVGANGIEEFDVASILFSTTPDLVSAYPASAVRQIGWQHTALMGCVEMDKPGGLCRCIRILLHWNTDRRPEEIHHIYLNGAIQLRPDLSQNSSQG